MPIPRSILHRISANDPDLTELNLSSQYPSLNARDMQELVDALKNNTYLETLILCDNAIKDEGALILATGLAHCHIKTVDVSINDIGNVGIAALIQAPILSLDVGGNSFSDDGLKLLANNSILKSLFIHENGLTDKCVQYLLVDKHLLEITLDRNELSHGEVLSIQKHIQQNVSLHVQKIIAEQLEPYIRSLPKPEKLATKQTMDEMFTRIEETDEKTPKSPLADKTDLSFFSMAQSS
jgi:hypothetical protein